LAVLAGLEALQAACEALQQDDMTSETADDDAAPVPAVG